MEARVVVGRVAGGEDSLADQPRVCRPPLGLAVVVGTERAGEEAEAVSEKLDKKIFVAIRSAGDTGQLYGSVATRDIAEVVTAGGFTIDRRQVILERPIKNLGLHPVRVALHPEVVVTVSLNVARSEDEAERQSRGEDVTMVKEEKLELETFNPEMFEEGASPAEGEEQAKEE